MNPPPVIPKVQSLPSQESGVKKANPLPYIFITKDSVSSTFDLTISNEGKAGAPFLLFNQLLPGLKPRKYTIESNKLITDNL